MIGEIWIDESGCLMWNLTIWETEFYKKSLEEDNKKLTKRTLDKLDKIIKERK